MSEVKKNKEEKSPNKKGGMVKIIIGVLLVLAVVGGGTFGGYYFAMKQKPVPKVEVKVKTDEMVFELKEFIVNLADEGGKKYLKVTLSIGYENIKLEPELKTKTPMIRDSINSVLRAKKSTDITQKGQEDIKQEILTRINPMFFNGKTTNVYFSEILVQ